MSGKKIKSRNNRLIDRFGRVHNYLRLSVTDRCNFACTYCKPDNKQCQTTNPLMTTSEIIELVKTFTEFGINKVRLTGGEPLVRKDIGEIIQELGKLSCELAITTNGYFLERYFHDLKAAGVKKINISLDTLQSERYISITKRNAFDRVYSNLVLAIKLGFEVKLNAVIMRGTNEDEIIDFALLTKKYPLTVRFIEFMPFRDNDWNFGKAFSQNEILETLSTKLSFNPEERIPGQTSEYFRLPDAPGKIGIISTLSHPFCDSCNRIRIMADGRLKNCLFGKKEYDLITPFREGENLLDIVHESLAQKHALHGGNKPFCSHGSDYLDNRNMYSIGG